MSRIKVINSDITDCGKRIGDTKRRFRWQFQIQDAHYTLQLVSSALSGKRTVTINSKQIYSEQSRLNFNFDYSQNLDGHNIRISKSSEGVNNFILLIDNVQFEELRMKKGYNFQIESQKAKIIQQIDPFSQFESFAKKSQIKTQNDFGDFNFDDFNDNKPKSQNKISKGNLNNQFQNYQQFQQKNVKNNASNINQIDPFETNNLNKFKSHQKQQQFISLQQFETNNYNVNNPYNGLRNQTQFSQTWGSQKTQKTQSSSKFKIEITAKQMANKVKMTIEKAKEKIMDSLI